MTGARSGRHRQSRWPGQPGAAKPDPHGRTCSSATGSGTLALEYPWPRHALHTATSGKDQSTTQTAHIDSAAPTRDPRRGRLAREGATGMGADQGDLRASAVTAARRPVVPLHGTGGFRGGMKGLIMPDVCRNQAERLGWCPVSAKVSTCYRVAGWLDSRSAGLGWAWRKALPPATWARGPRGVRPMRAASSPAIHRAGDRRIGGHRPEHAPLTRARGCARWAYPPGERSPDRLLASISTTGREEAR